MLQTWIYQHFFWYWQTKVRAGIHKDGSTCYIFHFNLRTSSYRKYWELLDRPLPQGMCFESYTTQHTTCLLDDICLHSSLIKCRLCMVRHMLKRFLHLFGYMETTIRDHVASNGTKITREHVDYKYVSYLDHISTKDWDDHILLD